MANVVGTATEDFVHVTGDGLQPPSQSWNNMPFATNAAEPLADSARTQALEAVLNRATARECIQTGAAVKKAVK